MSESRTYNTDNTLASIHFAGAAIGNLTYGWDFDNRLVSADVDNDNTADVTYKWDALGRRMLRDDGNIATVFVQSGQQTIADYTSGTAATSPSYTYIYASYIDEPMLHGRVGGLRYYHRNQQYSVIALTNGGGTLFKLDPSGRLAAKAVNPSASCGGGSMTWDFGVTGIDEGLIVQKRCVSWSQVICTKKDDCCKGSKRKACKVCFYERLRNFARDTVISIDNWGTSFTPKIPNCGTRGTVRFTAEVKAFPYVLQANTYDRNWTPIGKMSPCPDFILDVSDYSYQKPKFWDNGGETSSINSYMTATWKCCEGDGNQSQISYGTTGKERKVTLGK